MDTSRDFRILVAEKALNDLYNIIRMRRLNIPVNWAKTLDLTEKLRSTLLKIKYSYLPLNMLIRSVELKLIIDYTVDLSRILLDKQVLNRFKPNPYPVATVRYCLRTLYGLKYRLALGEENKSHYAVDIEGVEIVSVHRHPNADKLYITKAEGALPYTIITNIRDIKKGEIRAAAILPPAIIMGELSEAMYCSKPIPPQYKSKRPPETLIDTSEINNKVYEIIKELTKHK